MPKSKYTAEQIADAKEELKRLCPEGTTVYTFVRHCTSAGNLSIESFVIADGKPHKLTSLLCRAYACTFDKNHGGVKDFGTERGLVYDLSRWLHGDSYKLKCYDL